MAVWGVVVGLDTKTGVVERRPLLDSDFEWAVKMAYHEATGRLAEQEAVLWTVLNRWIGRYLGLYGTYGAFARRFSQPINETEIGKVRNYDRRAEELRSDRNGNITECLGGGAGSEECALARARARWTRIENNIKRPLAWYEEHAPATVALVRRFMLGQVPSKFPGWTDFAARFVAGSGGEIQVSAPEFGNKFYREPWAANWSTDTVKIEPPEGAAKPRPARAGLPPLLAVFLGVGGLLWSVFRKKGA